MSLEIKGTIKSIEEVQKGTSKDGKEWQKLIYTVVTDEQYNNLYALEVFGEEKVAQFQQYNKQGDSVKVLFNVNTNEWKGKYFTSLSSWRCEKNSVQGSEEKAPQAEEEEDLPF
jgi:hypothetical protein